MSENLATPLINGRLGVAIKWNSPAVDPKKTFYNFNYLSELFVICCVAPRSHIRISSILKIFEFDCVFHSRVPTAQNVDITGLRIANQLTTAHHYQISTVEVSDSESFAGNRVNAFSTEIFGVRSP